MYTNACSLIGKISELRYRAENFDLIGITETWATTDIQDAELAIKGFNMFRTDRPNSKGGGLLLYVREDLKSTMCTDLMKASFKESMWCMVSLGQTNLLVGLIYRAPSSDSKNDDDLLDLLDIAVMQPKMAHILLLGDFNYPEIDYVHNVVKAKDNAPSSRFMDKTQELFLCQHVRSYTRTRPGQTPSTLDYIFTEEENLIEQVYHKAPLGKSDHMVLEWFMVLQPDKACDNFEKFNYWKGNYTEISTFLSRVNWREEFFHKSVEEMWIIFKEHVIQQTSLHVPIKKNHSNQRRATGLVRTLSRG